MQLATASIGIEEEEQHQLTAAPAPTVENVPPPMEDTGRATAPSISTATYEREPLASFHSWDDVELINQPLMPSPRHEVR